MAKHVIFYPFLFSMLKRKQFLDSSFDKIIRHHSKRTKDFFFIQIGANDGLKADPIYLYVNKYHWKGILIEPVQYIFNKLKANYKDVKNLAFENSAIGEKNGFKNFYRLKRLEGRNIPLWYDEIGSFFKKNVLKHKDKLKDIEKYLITEKIRCSTLKSILAKYQVKKVDLLIIDAEGYDYQILKQIPFNKLKPKIIIFEDRHLSSNEKENCRKILIKNGYSIVRGIDCLAHQPL